MTTPRASSSAHPDDIPRLPAGRRYGLALLLVGIALVLTALINPVLGEFVFALFYIAVMISAWYGGLGPGLTATVLSIVLSDLLLTPPLFSFAFSPEGMLRLAVEALVAVAISSLVASRRKAERDLRVSNAALLAREREARAAAERAGGLHAIAADLSGALTTADVAAAILRHAGDVLGAVGGAVAVVTPGGDELELLSAAGYPSEFVESVRRFPLNAPIPLADAARTRQLVLVESREAALARYPELASVHERIALHAWANIPLSLPNGPVGAIEFSFAKPRGFGDDDRTFLLTLGQQCAQALDRARLYEGEQRLRFGAERARERMGFLAEASRKLAGSLDYVATLQQVADLAVPRIADWCVVDMLADDGRTLDMVIAKHVDPAKVAWAYELRRLNPVDLDATIGAPAVIRTGQAELYPVIDDSLLEAAARSQEELRVLRSVGYRSLMCVPLPVRGRVIGSIGFVLADTPRSFDADDLSFAQELADRAAVAIDNARLYQDTQQARLDAERVAARLARLQHVTAALSQAVTPEHVAEVVVQAGLDAIGADAGSIYALVDDGRFFEALNFRGYTAEPGVSHPRARAEAPSPLSEAVASRAIVAVESAAELVSRWPNLAESQRRSGDSATAAVPLLLNEQVLGVLYVAFRAPRRFTADDRAFLLSLAQQCAQALERARLYEAEQRARADAEAAVRLRDVFFSVAAHELKTPLTSLIGQAQLLRRRLQREAQLDERYVRGVDVVAAQAERLHRMINAMLDIARIEQGQLSIDRAPLDLVNLTRQVVEEIRPTLNRHAIDFTAGADMLTIEGDALRLEQVLQNLIGNAVKYSPEGGDVRVRVDRQGDWALVEVADAGIGIPASALPNLFKRFFRAGNVDRHQISGMGIGLYVVREIVGLHGGDVQVTSREGQGSRFSVLLPALPDGRDAALEHHDGPASAGDRAPGA